MRPRCIWSNKKSEHLKEIKVLTTNRWATDTQEETFYVLPQHEAAFRAFAADTVRHGKTLMLMVAVSVVLMLGASGLNVAGILSSFGTLLAVGASMVLLGGALVRFPFASPETIELLGVEKASRFARIAGWFTVALGLLLPFLVALDPFSS